MKIERIFDSNSDILLESIIDSLIKEKIDKEIDKLYSTTMNHTTSSMEGDVISC